MAVGDLLLGDRYRLLRQLGEGGMGQVWEARDETLGRLVAVKVIALLVGGGSRGDEARARFLREARITGALQHPNVVTVHDLGEADIEGGRAPFLVMELLRGEGLDAVVRRGPVVLPDAARWGTQICEALAHAHGAGVLHRDIKPSNVLVTTTGTVKVLDFGIARAADPYATTNHLTQTGFIVGTPPYMAPEQARGFPESRSDLYSLGCLLFELITGRPPFQAPDAVGYLTAHLAQEPPAPSQVAAHIPSQWDELVLTLLRKEPAQRYATASQLAHALQQLDRVPRRAREEKPPSSTEGRGPKALFFPTKHSRSSTTIDATPAEVMAVIADFDRYPEWTGEVKEAEILATDDRGRAEKVRLVMDAGAIKDDHTLAYTWTDDNEVSWSLVKSQMLRVLNGSYQLTALEGGTRTEVTYRLTVDVKIPVLGMIKRKAEKTIIDRALTELKKRVESVKIKR